MKKALMILITLIFAASLSTGCGHSQEKIQEDYLAMLEEPATGDNIDTVSDYLDKYLKKMDQETASHMIVAYEDYIFTFDQSAIDYNEWADKYEKYVLPSLTGLYRIKGFEQTSPMAEDAVLKISWAELVQRTYAMESFIKKYKGEHLIQEDATWIYGNYVDALVMGTTGTYIFDAKTHEFPEEAKTAYLTFVKDNPDTVTGWVLNEYFNYLEDIGYTMNYNDKESSKRFFNTCMWLKSESEKRVFQ